MVGIPLKLMENPTTTHKHCKIVDSESFLLFYKDRYFLGAIGKNKIQYLKSHNMFFEIRKCLVMVDNG